MPSLNISEVRRWKRDNGDLTHNLNYNLNADSIVIDLGGYTGVWAETVYNKYLSNIFILEPVPQFYQILQEKFSNNNNIKLLNVGISSENKKGTIFLNNDASSTNADSGEPVEVEFITMESALEKWNISKVDLLQINIEGEEYSLLEDMIAKKLLTKFKNIQIQFHMVVENFEDRREKIRQELVNNGFQIKFDYPFVWEGWSRT